MSMDWFRCYSEFSTDPKVQIMPEHMQRRLIMILCLRSNDVLATLHATEIAFSLRISEPELEETKELFISKGFIDNEWNILNWDKRQYVSDSSTERSRKHREKKKQEQELQQKQTHRCCNVAATTQTRPRPEGLGKDKTPLPPTEQSQPKSENGSFLKNGSGSGRGWDVLEHLSLAGDARARETAHLFNWDYQVLVEKYNAFQARQSKPPSKPDKAFDAWIISFTKGKPPT